MSATKHIDRAIEAASALAAALRPDSPESEWAQLRDGLQRTVDAMEGLRRSSAPGFRRAWRGGTGARLMKLLGLAMKALRASSQLQQQAGLAIDPYPALVEVSDIVVRGLHELRQVFEGPGGDWPQLGAWLGQGALLDMFRLAAWRLESRRRDVCCVAACMALAHALRTPEAAGQDDGDLPVPSAELSRLRADPDCLRALQLFLEAMMLLRCKSVAMPDGGVQQGGAWLARELPNTARFLSLLGDCQVVDRLYATLLFCTWPQLLASMRGGLLTEAEHMEHREGLMQLLMRPPSVPLRSAAAGPDQELLVRRWACALESVLAVLEDLERPGGGRAFWSKPIGHRDAQGQETLLFFVALDRAQNLMFLGWAAADEALCLQPPADMAKGMEAMWGLLLKAEAAVRVAARLGLLLALPSAVLTSVQGMVQAVAVRFKLHLHLHLQECDAMRPAAYAALLRLAGSFCVSVTKVSLARGGSFGDTCMDATLLLWEAISGRSACADVAAAAVLPLAAGLMRRCGLVHVASAPLLKGIAEPSKADGLLTNTLAVVMWLSHWQCNQAHALAALTSPYILLLVEAVRRRLLRGGSDAERLSTLLPLLRWLLEVSQLLCKCTGRLSQQSELLRQEMPGAGAGCAGADAAAALPVLAAALQVLLQGPLLGTLLEQPLQLELHVDKYGMLKCVVDGPPLLPAGNGPLPSPTSPLLLGQALRVLLWDLRAVLEAAHGCLSKGAASGTCSSLLDAGGTGGLDNSDMYTGIAGMLERLSHDLQLLHASPQQPCPPLPEGCTMALEHCPAAASLQAALQCVREVAARLWPDRSWEQLEQPADGGGSDSDADACGQAHQDAALRRSWEALQVQLLHLSAPSPATAPCQWEALFCCYAGCTNVAGPSELQLVTLACGGGCGLRYCSRACQAAAWVQGHKLACEGPGCMTDEGGSGSAG